MKYAARLGFLALTLAGCAFNGHRSMALTERFATSEVNVVAKTVGTPFLALGEALVSPITMAVDVAEGNPYHPDHKYFSYSASRTIARSDMSNGYQWLAGVLTAVIETIYLPITGVADIVWVLNDSED